MCLIEKKHIVALCTSHCACVWLCACVCVGHVEVSGSEKAQVYPSVHVLAPSASLTHPGCACFSVAAHAHPPNIGLFVVFAIRTTVCNTVLHMPCEHCGVDLFVNYNIGVESFGLLEISCASIRGSSAYVEQSR